MTNFLVLKAHAGITFIAFYQYGRQYNKEVQLPLEKKKIKLKILNLQKIVLTHSLYSHRGKRVGFGCYAAQQGGSTKNLLLQCFMVS